MSLPNEKNSTDDNNNLAVKFATRSSTKIYEHLLPRIDQDAFQADLPLLSINENSRLAERKRAFTGGPMVNIVINELDDEQAGYLAFWRNLFENKIDSWEYWTAEESKIPLESDELAFKYLTERNNDYAKSKFHITCQLSQGKEEFLTNHEYEAYNQRTSISGFNSAKEKLLKAIHPMLGNFLSNDDKTRCYSNLHQNMSAVTISASGKIGDENNKTIDSESNNNNSSNSSLSNNVVPVATTMGASTRKRNNDSNLSRQSSTQKNTAPPATVTSSSISNAIDFFPNPTETERRLRADKTEAKRRFQNILKRLKNIVDGNSPTSIVEALDVLELALELAPTSTNSLSVNSFNDHQEEELLEVLQNLINQLYTSRRWIARVRDTIHHATLDSLASDLDALRDLVSISDSLPLKCMEAIQVQQLIQETETWLRKARHILSLLLSPPTATATSMITAPSTSYGGNHSTSSSYSTRTSDSLNSRQSPSHGSSVSHQSRSPMAAASNKKCTMSEISELLDAASISLLPLPELSELQSLMDRTQNMMDQVEMFVELWNQLNNGSSKRNKRSKYDLDSMQSLLKDASNFPVVVPRVGEAMDVVSKGLAWREAVKEAAKVTPSLRKVETLTAEGLKLPFDFTKELDFLSDKRQQARLWLERLKKSFPKTTRVTRKDKEGSSQQGTSSSSGTTSGAEKLQLSEMKLMLTEGEQLYEEKNKELNKAQSLVDAAEELASRVRELLSMDCMEFSNSESTSTPTGTTAEGDSWITTTTTTSMDAAEGRASVIRTLESLLEEAEGMPVVLEEAALIRIHLQALTWATKLRPLLQAKSVKLNDMVKLNKEILKIRSSLPAALQSEVCLPPLAEETLVKNAIASAEAWIAKTKKIIVLSGDVRKGTTISTIEALLQESTAIPINLEPEKKPFYDVLSQIASWLQRYSSDLVSLGIPCTSMKGIMEHYLKKEIMRISHDDQPQALRALEDGAVPVAESSMQSEIVTKATNEDTEKVVAMTVEDEDNNHTDEINVSETSSDVVTSAAAEDYKSDDRGVTMAHLAAMLAAGSAISVNIPEMRHLEALHETATAWVQSLDTICPRRVGKRKVGSSTIASLEIRKNGLDARRGVSELVEAREKGALLNIAFTDELNRIDEAIHQARVWDAKVSVVMDALSEAATATTRQYLELIQQRSLRYPFLLLATSSSSSRHEEIDTNSRIVDAAPSSSSSAVIRKFDSMSQDIKDNGNSEGGNAAKSVDRAVNILNNNSESFSFFIDSNRPDCNSPVEEELWEEFEATSKPLLMLYKEFESTVFGSIPSTFGSLGLALGAVGWLKEVRESFVRVDWADCHHQKLESLKSDIYLALESNGRRKRFEDRIEPVKSLLEYLAAPLPATRPSVDYTVREHVVATTAAASTAAESMDIPSTVAMNNHCDTTATASSPNNEISASTTTTTTTTIILVEESTVQGQLFSVEPPPLEIDPNSTLVNSDASTAMDVSKTTVTGGGSTSMDLEEVASQELLGGEVAGVEAVEVVVMTGAVAVAVGGDSNSSMDIDVGTSNTAMSHEVPAIQLQSTDMLHDQSDAPLAAVRQASEGGTTLPAISITATPSTSTYENYNPSTEERVGGEMPEEAVDSEEEMFNNFLENFHPGEEFENDDDAADDDASMWDDVRLLGEPVESTDSQTQSNDRVYSSGSLQETPQEVKEAEGGSVRELIIIDNLVDLKVEEQPVVYDVEQAVVQDVKQDCDDNNIVGDRGQHQSKENKDTSSDNACVSEDVTVSNSVDASSNNSNSTAVIIDGAGGDSEHHGAVTVTDVEGIVKEEMSAERVDANSNDDNRLEESSHLESDNHADTSTASDALTSQEVIVTSESTKPKKEKQKSTSAGDPPEAAAGSQGGGGREGRRTRMKPAINWGERLNRFLREGNNTTLTTTITDASAAATESNESGGGVSGKRKREEKGPKNKESSDKKSASVLHATSTSSSLKEGKGDSKRTKKTTLSESPTTTAMVARKSKEDYCSSTGKKGETLGKEAKKEMKGKATLAAATAPASPAATTPVKREEDDSYKKVFSSTLKRKRDSADSASASASAATAMAAPPKRTNKKPPPNDAPTLTPATSVSEKKSTAISTTPAATATATAAAATIQPAASRSSLASTSSLSTTTSTVLKIFIDSCISKSKDSNLSEPVEELCALWLALLLGFLRRLQDAQSWAKETKTLLDRASAAAAGSLEKNRHAEVHRLLEVARCRRFHGKQRKELEDQIVKVEDWSKVVHEITPGNKFEYNKMQDIIRKGDSLIFDRPELPELKRQFAAAKSWMSRYQKLDLTKGVFNSADLWSLYQDSLDIQVDLSSYVEIIQTSSKPYCLCRQHYYGEMVQCDICDDWYHLACVGLTKLQADKMDKFTCIRCTLHQSFQSAVDVAVGVVKRWMAPDEPTKQREIRLNKIVRKKQKEEKDMFRLQHLLEEEVAKHTSFQSSPGGTSASSPSRGMESSFGSSAGMAHDGESSISAVAVASALLLPTNESQARCLDTIRNIQMDLEACKRRVIQYMNDEVDEQNISRIEISKHSDIVEWMAHMRAILCPVTQEQAEQGRPTETGVSPAIRMARQWATRIGVIAVPDVVLELEAFEWMSWCFRCLLLLRAPTASKVMRKLYEEAKNHMRLSDEKIVKALGTMVNRVSTWKSKVRKLLWGPKQSAKQAAANSAVAASDTASESSSQVMSGSYSNTRTKTSTKVDAAKVQSLLAEGESIVVQSRLKGLLRTLVGDSSLGSPPASTSTSTVTRGKKLVTATSTAGASYTLYSGTEIPNSSDEESHSPEALQRYQVSPLFLAPITQTIWPPANVSFIPLLAPTTTSTTTATTTTSSDRSVFAPSHTEGIANLEPTYVVVNDNTSSTSSTAPAVATTTITAAPVTNINVIAVTEDAVDMVIEVPAEVSENITISNSSTSHCQVSDLVKCSEFSENVDGNEYEAEQSEENISMVEEDDDRDPDATDIHPIDLSENDDAA